MRDFVDASERLLATLAGETVAGPSPAPRTSRTRGRATRPLIALAGVMAITILLGSSAELAQRTRDLRVWSAPEANAASLSGRPGAPPAASYDYARSRPFATPDGQGYVVPSHGERSLCLVLPDATLPGTFGSSCVRTATVARRGTIGQMVRPARGHQPGRVLTAFVLPAGASPDVRVTSGDREVSTSVAHGVVVVVTTAAATLRYEAQGRVHLRELGAPFREADDVTIACGDELVRVDVPPTPRGGGAPPRLNTARLCR